MKKLSIVLLGCFVYHFVSAQAGIYMYISPSINPNITFPAESPSGHTGESLIASYSMGIGNGTTIGSGSGGSGTSKVYYDSVVISKLYSIPSHAITYAIALGAHVDSVVLRFYNASNQKVYSITYATAFFTHYVTSGSGCPSGCPNIAEDITLVCGGITYRDFVNRTYSTSNIINNIPSYGTF